MISSTKPMPTRYRRPLAPSACSSNLYTLMCCCYWSWSHRL